MMITACLTVPLCDHLRIFVHLGQKGLFHWVNLQQYDEFQELSVLTKNYEAINKPGPSQVSTCWLLPSLFFVICQCFGYDCGEYILHDK